MGIFRKAGRAFGKANLAVTNATTPSWRKQKPKPQTSEPDYTGRDNVVNLRVKKGRESYDLLVDDSDIHVAYQSKEGKTKWRKAEYKGEKVSVGGIYTAIDPGSPPSSEKLNRHWGTSFKSSQGTYSGLDAQVKYLNDLGYDVQALDKRPVKAWRSGNKQDSDRFVQEVIFRPLCRSPQSPQHRRPGVSQQVFPQLQTPLRRRKTRRSLRRYTMAEAAG